jgi:hypothetical protein
LQKQTCGSTIFTGKRKEKDVIPFLLKVESTWKTEQIKYGVDNYTKANFAKTHKKKM